jgi:hypothetical protein
MAVLVVGPTTVGKSTFLKSENVEALGVQKPKILFGFQLHQSEIPAESLIHYNLLNPAIEYRDDLMLANERWDFFAKPVFKKVISSGLLSQCVVLVAPLSELAERINNRRVDEDHGPNFGYDSEFWTMVVQRLDLCSIYEILFCIFDQFRIPYKVLFSSGNRFLPSDRAFVRANLEGHYVPLSKGYARSLMTA